MDFLAAEIAKKRKEIESKANDGSAPNKKYIRQKDIAAERERKYREDQERLKAEREAKAAAKLEEARKREEAAREREARLKKEREEKIALEKAAAAVKELTDEEVQKRLRELDEPVRLFAETPEDRKTRLENLEARIAAEKRRLARLEAAKQDDIPDFEPLENLRPDTEELQLNRSDIRKNPNKVYEQLYRYFKVTCQEWSKYMDEQDPEYKNSPEGIEALKIQKQCLEDFRPLFKALKRKNLEPDIFPLFAEICYYAQQKEYVQASDAYYKLSIGNAPWPIGVVAVGIHERSSADRIQYAAHVFNDELMRKQVQGVKRWLTFMQAKYPSPDRRKMMG